MSAGSVTGARFTGSSVLRKEDARLLSGTGRYVADIALPRMVHAVFVRSPHARAVISRIDVKAARGAAGVIAVFTDDDLAPLAHEVRFLDPAAPVRPYTRVLARDDVRYTGEPVAIVLAGDRYRAEDAAELVEIDYEPQPPVLDMETAADSTDLVHPELPTNIMQEFSTPPDAELDHILATADVVVTETLRQQRQAHVPMETRGLVASWTAAAGALEIWASTQCPHEMRAYFAGLIGIPESRVRVVAPDVGGGFGQKSHPSREECAVVLAATLAGRPVQWIEDRHENLTAAYHARHERATVTMALTHDGTMLALTVDHLDDVGAFTCGGLGSAGPLVGRMISGPYRIPKVAFTSRAVHTNTCGYAPYRGPWMMETLAREVIVDRAARAVGLDPAELRRRNTIAAGDQPFTTASGMNYDRVSPAQTLEQALDLLGRDGIDTARRDAAARGRLLGVGLSAYIEPSALGFGPLAIESATVRLEPSGTVTVTAGTSSHGQGLETTLAQVAADLLGLSPDAVTVHQGDTAVSSFGGGTVGSRSAVMGGAAVRLAATEVRDKVVRLAAHVLEAAPEDLELHEGRVGVRGAPSTAVPLSALALSAYVDPSALPAGMEPGLEATSRFAGPMFTFSNATQGAVVEVDPATGEVALRRFVVSEDCGVMINPMVVAGQIAGGVVQGLGGALLEEVVYDPDGNPLATTFLDYLPPTAADVPPIDVGHVVTPSASPGGHKGMGEGGAIGAPAAVLNAVNDALAPLGVAINDQPLSPHRVLAAIAGALQVT